MSDYTFPVLFEGARITSGVGARNAPIAGASTNHRGIDIAAPRGSPVVAPTDLTVVFAGTASGYGNAVYGVDTMGRQFRFAHLDSIGVSEGAIIGQGQQIGTVGSTGRSTGNHLHFEVRDRAGNFLRDATENVINRGRQIAGDAIDSFLRSNPATAPFAMIGDGLGISGGDLLGGDGCGINPICHLRKWLEETQFIERGALYIVATIFIIGGIAFLALGYNPKNIVQELAKAGK